MNEDTVPEESMPLLADYGSPRSPKVGAHAPFESEDDKVHPNTSRSSLSAVRFASRPSVDQDNSMSVGAISQAEGVDVNVRLSPAPSDSENEADHSMPLLQFAPSTSFSATTHTKVGHVSIWENFKDMEYVAECYPALNAAEVSKATAQLELVMDGAPGAAVCDTEFKNVLTFKNKVAKAATLLHFAIWLTAETDHACTTVTQSVNTLLDSLQDPDEIFIPGELPSKKGVTYFSAQHLAASLGLLEVLEVLLDHACTKTSEQRRTTPQEFVNLWARRWQSRREKPAFRKSQSRSLVHVTFGLGESSDEPTSSTQLGSRSPQRTLSSVDLRDETDEQGKRRVKLFQPIHEATFQGHADVTLWLLHHGADPCSRSSKRITPLHYVAFCGICGCTGKTVISKLSALVNAFIECGQRTGQEVLEAKADMSKLIHEATRVTPLQVAVEDASKFPQDCVGLLAPCLANAGTKTFFHDIKGIAAVTSQGALRLVQAIVEKGKTDSQTLRLFRLSAQLEDSSDILASIFYTAPLAACEMLDLLEIDPVVEDSAHHPLPAHASFSGYFHDFPMRTAYQDNIMKTARLAVPAWEWKSLKRSEANWQAAFLPNVVHRSRNKGIKNVKTVAYLIPGLLDIDIFMALANLQSSETAVLNKRGTQGALCCLWDNLVEPVWCVNTFWKLLDLMGIVVIAYRAHEITAFSYLAPLSFAVMLASVVRYLTEFALSVLKCAMKVKEFGNDSIMASMWSPFSTWLVHAYFHQWMLTVCMLCAFIMKTSTASTDFSDSVTEKIVFSFALFMVGFQFVAMFRLSVLGSSLYTVWATAVSSAVAQILFVFAMMLAASILILFVISQREGSVLVVAALRGWLFGDGVLLGNTAKAHAVQTTVALVGAFLFNIIALNITIAVYGHEYDKAHDQLKFMFLRGRAHYCVKCILESYWIQWKGAIINKCMGCTAVCAVFLSVYLAVAHGSIFGAGVLLGCAQRLLTMTFMQCDWFSPEGIDSNGNLRFLWISFPQDWQSWLMEDEVGATGEKRAKYDKDDRKQDMYIKQLDMEQRLAVIGLKMDRVMDALEAQRHDIPVSPSPCYASARRMSKEFFKSPLAMGRASTQL